ncbi:GNAT family N-acetyltransferase [Paenibacillus paridis]|uniref:GNAT family N-acetyltransferase n=1 Tax=Paenibacillus paridis TaxID=2583376 RepID=UPI00111D3C21|nr:GNAT family N-acetyltransferase [Paenibacillus paridis]
MGKPRNVAVFIYEQVDTLDVTGPYDVFAVSSNWGKDFDVYTVGERQSTVHTVSGLAICPKYGFDNCPAPDILVIPGGLGARKEMNNEAITAWIQKMAASAEHVLSVCTGALLLAKANVLDGLQITTNRRAIDLLREAAPTSAKIVEDVRYVDNGQIILSAGVTAGMDAALHLVRRLLGSEKAHHTASMLEYHWREPGFSGLVPKASLQEDEKLLIRKAGLADLEAMLQLYREAARWIHSHTGFLQWPEASFTEEYLTSFIEEQEVFAAFLKDELVGCFSLQWQYEEIWGDQFHENAGYVHRLAVSRNYKGQGFGSRILAWAGHYIGSRGKAWLRLDCMADNPALNRYYLSQGMTFRGRFDSQGWSANLYEREIKREEEDLSHE